jgi:prevent-host-death family protein
MTVMTSREFNQDSSGAKKAAASGPVFITDRGRPSHVLLTIEEYTALRRAKPSVVDLLSMHEAADIEFDPPKIEELGAKPVDFS